MKLKDDFLRDYSAEQKLFVHRELIAFLGIILLSAILLLNLYFLQVIQHSNYSTRANENRIKLVPEMPRRGLICDRNGIVIALNRTVYQLKIVPEKIDNLALTLKQLQPLIDLTSQELDSFQKERKRAHIFTSIVLKRSLTELQIARFAINQYRFHGVEITSYQERFYPYGSTLTHVLGYVSKINHNDIHRLKKNGKWSNYSETRDIGKLGIEGYYEDILHGQVGYAEVEVNNHGRVIRQLHEKAPQPGRNIHLTIDLKLQQYITTLLEGSRAAAVVTDPRTGEVLAMVSMPNYNPNLFVGGISRHQYNILLHDGNHPLINRATQGIYPPASTIKPYITIAALMSGVIEYNTTLFDPGWWQLPHSKKFFHDWKHSGHGILNIIKALEESSDTFFYKIAYDMGINQLSEWMKKFGYGCLTGIDLAEETSGIMPTREWKMQRFHEKWYQGDTISVGIGQGYWSATPIQMNKALMLLINNGTINIPHLLLDVTQGEHKISWCDLHAPSHYQVSEVNREYWHIAKEGMYGVANHANGTASKSFANAPYKIGAKSGTAQVFGLKGMQAYNSNMLHERLRDHKIMIAYAPYHQPRIAVAMILENGGSGVSIGKVTRQILDYYIIRTQNQT
ncbi:Peptidoglycan D,D-transpeptidase MrdA [Candidatus Erwinia haradaeae]|uniref:Peptidoglycan D,D-transpeptidase MrdA n=1 Tax=Candidatus Erwinia haradaeae TaxID=1922217 RepID=A0A451DCH2_9GAMM|nr:peptidoglycan DD-transpeptidase MrdA [Candidatus Erwinia haradaeae]VFP84135.1 Peptidoglycan D,D-transpeptidase MrdA [Candidatus Erwinia haradaeae]